MKEFKQPVQDAELSYKFWYQLEVFFLELEVYLE